MHDPFAVLHRVTLGDIVHDQIYQLKSIIIY